MRSCPILEKTSIQVWWHHRFKVICEWSHGRMAKTKLSRTAKATFPSWTSKKLTLTEPLKPVELNFGQAKVYFDFNMSNVILSKDSWRQTGLGNKLTIFIRILLRCWNLKVMFSSWQVPTEWWHLSCINKYILFFTNKVSEQMNAV